MKDKEIIALYYKRDEAAISKTKEKYEAYCLAVSGNILGNADDAQECVNDAYLKAWNSIPPQNPERLSTYLGKIVRNLAFDRCRRMHAEKRGGGETAAVLEELSECLSGGESVETQIERTELLREIDAYLDGLPKEQCNLFVLRYWYAMPVSDIARRMGMSASNASTQLSRIRRNLKEYLNKRGFEI